MAKESGEQNGQTAFAMKAICVVPKTTENVVVSEKSEQNRLEREGVTNGYLFQENSTSESDLSIYGEVTNDWLQRRVLIFDLQPPHRVVMENEKVVSENVTVISTDAKHPV